MADRDNQLPEAEHIERIHVGTWSTFPDAAPRQPRRKRTGFWAQFPDDWDERYPKTLEQQIALGEQAKAVLTALIAAIPEHHHKPEGLVEALQGVENALVRARTHQHLIAEGLADELYDRIETFEGWQRGY